MSKKKKKDSIFVASALANLMAGALVSPKSANANVETPSPPPPPLAEEKTAIEIPPVEETTTTNFEMPPEGTEATILLTPEEKNPPIPAVESEEKDETHVKIELEEKLVDVRRDNDNATTAKIEASPSSDFRRKRTRRMGLSRRRGPLRRQQENVEEEHQSDAKTNLVELIPRDIEAKDEEVEEVGRLSFFHFFRISRIPCIVFSPCLLQKECTSFARSMRRLATTTCPFQRDRNWRS